MCRFCAMPHLVDNKGSCSSLAGSLLLDSDSCETLLSLINIFRSLQAMRRCPVARNYVHFPCPRCDSKIHLLPHYILPVRVRRHLSKRKSLTRLFLNSFRRTRRISSWGSPQPSPRNCPSAFKVAHRHWH